MKKVEFQNNNFLMDFLSLATEKDLKNSVKVSKKKELLKKKNFLKIEKVRKIEQVQTADGNVTVKISESLNKYFDRSD